MRRILLIVLLLVVVLPTLALTVVLFSAHRQIDAIDPPLPEVDAMLASVDGPGGPTSVRYVNSATQPTSDGGEMGHAAFVLDWDDGRRFIIDLGMDPQTAIAFGEPMEAILDSGATIPHGAVAEQMGEGVRSVGGIAFTHLHHDHTQGIVAFCDARQAFGEAGPPIFQTPYQFEERNHTTDMGFAFIDAALNSSDAAGCAKPTRLEPGPLASVHPVAGFPGLAAISAGGHTPGSTIYLTRVADRHWLFSGDITNTRAELVGNIPKAGIYSLLVVPENTERLEKLRRWLKNLDDRPDLTVVVSHDLTALQETSIAAW